MEYWDSLKFDCYFGGFFLLSLILVLGLGSSFVSWDTESAKTYGIAIACLALSLALAWRLARDAIVYNRREAERRRQSAK